MLKKVLVAGYPKSGNTWIGYMLSYLLGGKYIELGSPDSQKVTLQKEILALIDGNVPHKTDYDQICKTHERYNFVQKPGGLNLDTYDKVIVIVRDPRDVAVSYFYYKYYNLPIAINAPERMLSQKSWPTKKVYWKKHVTRTAQEWNFHTISWRTFEGRMIIRYEDLRNDTTGELKKVCDYLGVSADESFLNSVVKLFSFEKLSGGRKAGQEYKTAFFRKGITGDYKNHFDFIDDMIVKHYAGNEMKSLGYR